MPKTTIEKIIESRIESFKFDFLYSSREVFTKEKSLIHASEFGTTREVITREFLKSFINPEYNIGNGFISSSKDDISTQCDIIISHKSYSPLIKDSDNTQFFPIEPVVGIGEVKSVLSKENLKEALNKLAKSKKLKELCIQKESSIVKQRYKMEYDPAKNQYDLPVTFLICEKFDFNIANLHNELNQLYLKDILPRHKHNFLLSIKDGLFTYYDRNSSYSTTIQYPVLNGNILKNLLIKESNNISIKLFASFLAFSIQNATVFEPYLVDYLSDFDGQILNFEK